MLTPVGASPTLFERYYPWASLLIGAIGGAAMFFWYATNPTLPSQSQPQPLASIGGQTTAVSLVAPPGLHGRPVVAVKLTKQSTRTVHAKRLPN